jgi:dTDP-4-amino-4,6-dideoxygalactose transaminase
MQAMLDSGISTRRGVMCAHREPTYAQEAWLCGAEIEGCPHSSMSCHRLRESEHAQDRAIILPLFHELTDNEQRHVAHALREACVRSVETTARSEVGLSLAV